MIKALILLTTPVLIWGLSKKELLAKRFSFSQFAVNQHIDFKSSGEYQLYLENAMTPRWEQGRFKIINNVVYLTFEKCSLGFEAEDLSKQELIREEKFACGKVWGSLKCKLEPAGAITYTEVFTCDRKDQKRKPKDEKSPLMVLQNTNSRPKENAIVQINGREIQILAEKPHIIKNSTNIYNAPEESNIRPCPGPVACKAPYLTQVGESMRPRGITVQKYVYKGSLVHWYIFGSDEYGLWYVPGTGME